ncbi:RidA family protein [Comamonas endophytica]|uniref:RidA family protein n=1 Tax=Comamonas endophytica TaxID=2949090 RepID=A0ABY6GB72_9BURK|nr:MULTISPECIES: RidA family protein [unclassified Acidovorax]MCD2513677.1 RidA family protein [Acidovorax sp. D4N7]UYG52316.1 RidA family protein [Acidovorax sp. 5MLIR]
MSATTPGIAQPLARYAAWRRAGDMVFLSGIIAVDPTAGRIVRGYADIPDEAAALIGRTGEFSSDIREGPILAQSWYVLDRIRQTIEAAGGQMSDVIKLVQYFKDLDHFPQYSRVRRQFFPGEPPASTVVEVSGMLPTPEILIEVEATAWLPQR